MRLFRRPDKPADFEQQMQPHREAIEVQGAKPKFEGREVWKRHKKDFAEAQHDKCAYCETNAQAGQWGDIEHFRPKSRYPWLAYSWENWLLSCLICNRSFKQADFPVEEELPLEPGVEDLEKSLLLDPCGGEPPARHLRFNDDGSIEARTEVGRHTIRTLGLDRSPLVKERAQLASRLRRTLQALRRPGSLARERFEDLLEMGADHAYHAGMVRIIVEQELHLSWELLTHPGSSGDSKDH